MIVYFLYCIITITILNYPQKGVSILNACKLVEKVWHTFIVDENVNWSDHIGDSLEVP